MEEILIGTMAGLMFQCSASDSTAGFELFAPDAAATAGYRGDIRSLYEYKNEGMGAEDPEGYEQVFDMLPDSLMLSWRVTNNSPVELTISDYDAVADSARFTMTYDTNPDAAASQMAETSGECRVLPVQEEMPS